MVDVSVSGSTHNICRCDWVDERNVHGNFAGNIHDKCRSCRGIRKTFLSDTRRRDVVHGGSSHPGIRSSINSDKPGPRGDMAVFASNVTGLITPSCCQTISKTQCIFALTPKIVFASVSTVMFPWTKGGLTASNLVKSRHYRHRYQLLTMCSCMAMRLCFGSTSRFSSFIGRSYLLKGLRVA